MRGGRLSVGSPTPASCPEGGIATNGDNLTQVSQAQGQLWTATSTQIAQTYTRANAEIHMGAVYWVVGTSSFDTTRRFTLTSQGYIAPEHEDLSMPAMAATPTSGGRTIMLFTLTGNGGPTGADHGGFFPSTAFGRLTSTSGGMLKSTVNIADLGQSPQDGFTEYQGFPGPTRPRWGDYSWGLFVPGTGGRIYFANNYIQYANCTGIGVRSHRDRNLRRNQGWPGQLGNIGQLRRALNRAAAGSHRVFERTRDPRTEDTIRPRAAGLVAALGPGTSLLT